MKILLLKPPIRGFLHEIGRHTPIGLAYLSAVLRAAGHETILFDALAFTEDNHVVGPEHLTATDRRKLVCHPRWQYLLHWGASWARISSVLEQSSADVVGISCMFSPYYETAYELARLTRRCLPDAHILLGGPHATVAYQHALAVPEVDVAVLGEAETTIVPLVEALASHERLDAIEGVAFRCGRGLCACQSPKPDIIHARPRQRWLQELDQLPFPAGDQLDFARYGNATALITSRGCPFSCTFCTVHATVGKKFRARSPRSVVDEIEHFVARFGVRRFLIEDDNFTFDVDRVIRICREIQARRLEVELRLPNGITVVKLSRDLVAAMQDAGFKHLFLGLETTDPRRLRQIAKGFTSLDQVAEGARWFQAAGAQVSASLIVGLPGQPLHEIARDVSALARRGIRFWSNPFYPIPGSPDYSRCIELGVIDDTTDYALFDQYNFAIGSDIFSPAQLYWVWVVTQSAAQWPGFVHPALKPRTGSLESALESLVALASASSAGGWLEVPAIPIGFDRKQGELQFWLDANTCFCTAHQLARGTERRRTHHGLCRFGGDVVAAALSLHSAAPLGADEVACRLDGSPHCTFRLSGDATAWPTVEGFLRALEDTRDPIAPERPAQLPVLHGGSN